jgi:hypothetical protein
VGAISNPSGAAKSPPRHQSDERDAPRARAAIDFLAMAQPWMRLGWQMTAASFAMQARVAKAAMDIPPATVAMRQGTDALNAWLALVGAPRTRKD